MLSRLQSFTGYKSEFALVPVSITSFKVGAYKVTFYESNLESLSLSTKKPKHKYYNFQKHLID